MTIETNILYPEGDLNNINLDYLLRFMILNNSTDITVLANEFLYAKINKSVWKTAVKIEKSEIETIVREIARGDGITVQLYKPTEVDGTYSFKFNKEEYNFRYNIALSFGLPFLNIRKLINKIPSFEDIQLKDESITYFEKMNKIEPGICLVVGATGSGKSTTIVTMLHKILSDHQIKVISIEDPIEFYFKNENYENSFITQREVGYDTQSFYMALRAAMRQNPDIIFLGEIRDKATAEAALYASQTGHLVIATLHANNPDNARDRLKNLLEGTIYEEDILLAVMYQELHKTTEGVKAVRDIWINQ